MSVQNLVILVYTLAKLLDYGQPDLFYALCAIFICILQPTGFMGPIVHDKCIKFGDPCLNRSQEIPPEAVFNNCQPEVASGVIYSVVGVFFLKICDSKSNRNREIQLPHLVTDDDASHHIRPYWLLFWKKVS